MVPSFIDRFGEKIMGVINGFDRIVFKGIFQPLMHAGGVYSLLSRNGCKNTEFKEWMDAQTKRIERSAERFSREHCGEKVQYLRTWRERKEELAHEKQKKRGIESGVIGVWSCLESGMTYQATYVEGASRPALKKCWKPQKHLYFYMDDPTYGFMNIRLQTWFPYSIQICMNGREWLRRSLETEQIAHLRKGNKFLHIEDYGRAQALLSQQLDTQWNTVLDQFIPFVFPDMESILWGGLTYYWTLWQSEWATDMIFKSQDYLESQMDRFRQHAFMTGNSGRILNYMGHPIDDIKNLPRNFKRQISSRLGDFGDFHEGGRVKHWMGCNSVKLYNEYNILRVEMTMNEPKDFKAFRHKQGEPTTEKKTLCPLRKGVADIPLRAKVSQQINDRFLDNMGQVKNDRPVSELLDMVTRGFIKNGKKVRGLDPLGKDLEILRLLADPKVEIDGVTNKSLRPNLAKTKWGKGRTDRQLSARLSRAIRLLRDHGVLHKVPKQRKYRLSKLGRILVMTTTGIRSTTIEKLLEPAA